MDQENQTQVQREPFVVESIIVGGVNLNGLFFESLSKKIMNVGWR